MTLVEREPQLMSHASGRNAAIYRPLEAPAVVTALATAAAPLLDELCGGRAAWLRPTGLLLTAAHGGSLDELSRIAAAHGIAAQALDRAALLARAPLLAGGPCAAALWLPGAGVIDNHAVGQALERRITARGGVITRSNAVVRIEPRGARVDAVVVGDERLAADVVVIAGGAWAAALGATVGAPLLLTPMRRHLAMLTVDAPLAPAAPTVWDVELGCYWRPEAGGILASPGDAAVAEPGEPPTDPAAIELLAERLATLAPGLASARVRRAWACLRTFAPDRAAVVGRDARVEGLAWLAGLGGHGMSAALGTGPVLAAALDGAPHPLAAALAPLRAQA